MRERQGQWPVAGGPEQKRLQECGECIRKTNHVIRAFFQTHWSTPDLSGGMMFAIVQCQGCENVSFRIERGCEDDYEIGDDGTREDYVEVECWPRVFLDRRPLTGTEVLPELVHRLYEEVYGALRENLDVLATVGLRGIVERTCVELGAKGRGLEQKLASAVKMGKLLPEDVKSLEPIRLFGNSAAHEIDAPDRRDLVKALGVVENFVERVFIVPDRAAGLTKRAQAKKIKKRTAP